MRVELRDYQIDGINKVRHEFATGKKSVLYTLPTGGGKTIIFSHIAEQSASKGKRAYILVHREELLLQGSRHLASLGVPHGRIAPGHSMTRDRIQIASVQTLVRRLDKYEKPDLIIIDECQHALASTWKKIIDHYKGSFILGVTATPIRTDGKGLGVSSGGVFDSMVLGPSMRDLINRGFLTEPIIYAPPMNFALDDLHTRGGDYIPGEIQEKMDKPKITGCAIDHYAKLCNGQPAIAFCATVQHATHVSESFQAAGFRARMLDGKANDSYRKQTIEMLGTGEIQILSSCDIVSEGTDIPIVGAAILLRPTKSTGLYMQQVGRALRPYHGKENTIILDHVGNVLRHGLPDEDRKWSLDGVEKRNVKEIKIRKCPKCYFVHVPAPVCPSCGFVYKTDREPVERIPEQVDGSLKKLDVEKLRDKSRLKREVAEADSYERLREIAHERGYKPYWANIVWQVKCRKRGIA